MKRWARLQQSVDSALAQPNTAEVLLVIDHNDELAEAASERWSAQSRVRVVENSHRQGLSGARNTAIELAEHELLAFLDDDAVADKNWLEPLVRLLENDPQVVASGGRALPAWPNQTPGAWLPVETLWVVGCSFTGQPEQVQPVRNLMGCSMLFRKAALQSVNGFNEATGRVGTLPLGAEETEACIHITAKNPEAKILFQPASVVYHEVSPDRLTYKYLVRRGYYEGISKAYISERMPKSVLSVEQSYAFMLLGHTALYALRGKLRYAAALPSLLTATVAGYGQALVKLKLEDRRSNRSQVVAKQEVAS
jgi:GT2 family glycosyltransferase